MKYSILVVGLSIMLFATDVHSSDELLAVVAAEQAAFKEGNCDTVTAMIDKDVTFYMNGQRRTREQVGNFCRMIKRPFGAGRKPLEDETAAYMVSETLGYTVRDFRWESSEDEVVHEVVTKIWQKGEDGWKMIHFQSTVIPE